MALSHVEQELRDHFLRFLRESILPLKGGPDPEVALEALAEASEMLAEQLRQELAELRLEQVA